MFRPMRKFIGILLAIISLGGLFVVFRAKREVKSIKGLSVKYRNVSVKSLNIREVELLAGLDVINKGASDVVAQSVLINFFYKSELMGTLKKDIRIKILANQISKVNIPVTLNNLVALKAAADVFLGKAAIIIGTGKITFRSLTLGITFDAPLDLEFDLSKAIKL